MLHVWITPHPCGPFAALEGVGAGQIKEGETRLCDTAHGHGDLNGLRCRDAESSISSAALAAT